MGTGALRGLGRYAWPAVTVGAAAVVASVGPEVLRTDAIGILFLIPVFISAMLGGLGPGLAAVLLSLAVGNWLFIEPDRFIPTAVELPGQLSYILVGTTLAWMVARRRGAERALRDSEERFRTAQELSLDGFAVFRAVRDRAGRIVDFEWVYANPVAEQTTGRGSLGGKRLLMELPDLRNRSDVFDRYVAVVESGQPYDAEFPYEGDGVSGWFRNMAVKLEDGLAVSFTDITTRKKAEDSLRELNQTLEDRVAERTAQLERSREALRQSERLAAIGQTMTGLSHESRNALQRSLACVEMLGRRVKDQPTLERLVAEVRKAQDDLLRVYENVQDYARPINLNRVRMDVGEAWREAWAKLVARHGRDAALVEDCEGADLECLVDPVQMELVFRNLMDNTLAACPDPVRIRIQCTAELGGSLLRIRFQDNGPGLEPEQRQHVFEPFYTTKTRGTGLGLAIVRRIVEAHGGRVTLGPPLDRGLEVVIELPRGKG